MFPTKAVAHWVDRRKSAAAVLSEDRGPSDNYHVAVGAYLRGGFGPPACADVTIGRVRLDVCGAGRRRQVIYEFWSS